MKIELKVLLFTFSERFCSVHTQNTNKEMIRILKADPIRQMLADIFPVENLRIVNLCFPELYLGKEVHN
jgi:hypothetical protein